MKSTFFVGLISAFCFVSCSKEKATVNRETTDSLSLQTENESPTNNGTFDISSLPVSTADLGSFPFFSFPDGLKELNDPIEKKFNRIYFPINGVMTPFEGRTWAASISSTEGVGSDYWSLPYFEKSYDEAIKAVGGVKIFD